MTDDVTEAIDKIVGKLIQAYPPKESNLASKFIIATLPDVINQRDYNNTLTELEKMAQKKPQYTDLINNTKEDLHIMRKLNTENSALGKYTKMYLGEIIASSRNKISNYLV